MNGKAMTVVVFALCAAVANARTRESFNDGWEFSRDGKAFEAVRVPHDWAIAGPFDPKGDGNTGKLPWRGEGVYRKTLVLPAEPQGRVFLDFDGVMAHAAVLVNGKVCGRGTYGYLGFRTDATAYLLAGTNTIEVKCDTHDFHSRWYPGAGMYRNVWIVRTDRVYLKDDSLSVETRNVLSGEATLKVEGEIANRRRAKARAVVTATLKDRTGRTVASADEDGSVDGYDDEDFDLKLKVRDPELWEMKDGAALYTLEVSIKGEGFSDSLVRRIGLREFRFDPDNGFILNGKRVQLNGVNLHSDLGPLGMAFDEGAMRRQLAIMRDMGANALRTSHNCPAPEVLDLCDEMGIFVWNECFDKWNETCGRGTEPLEEFVPRILRAWVRRDRTHPSVFCWSIGNEITPGDATPPGQESWDRASANGTSEERCALFARAVRAEDRTRPVTIGSCFPQAALRGDYAPLDLSGWNYRGMYDKVKAKYPEKPVLYSESASAFSEYGFYAASLPTNKTNYALASFNVDSYDRNSAPWSDIPDREFFRMERDRYCAGEFVWTGIDYLGEPSPYAGSGEKASRSSYFGICDLCALPKDRFYLYRSHWNKDAFTLHIVPHHWNFPEKAGKSMPVFVYTSADEAELFVNGKSMGRRRKDPKAGNLDDYYSVLPRYRLMWMDVPYEAGEVRAVAYGKDGKALGTQVLRTAGKPVKIVLENECGYPNEHGEYLSVVKVTLADKFGNFVPNDNRRIRFAAEGCEIAAVGNSDPRGTDSFKEPSSHPLCFGRAAVYLRYSGKDSPKLRATAEGLEPAEMEVRIRR